MNYLDTLTVKQQNELITIKGNVQERSFRYDLLDNLENFKVTLDNVESGSGNLNVNYFLDVKRSGNFVLVGENENIDFQSNRVKIYITLDNGLVRAEYPLGVYLLSSPMKLRQTKNFNRYNVTFYSKLQILLEDKLNETLVIQENANYTNEIKALMIESGLDVSRIEFSNATFNRQRTFEIGTSKLAVINKLLTEINFEKLYTDNDGFIVTKPVILDKKRVPDFDYLLDEESIIENNSSEELDLFNIPNSFTIVSTNPDNIPIISTFKNYDVNDITSIPSRGREIDYYEEVSDITDQTSLDEHLQIIREKETQIYGKITFNTALNPLHVYNECYNIETNKFVEESYTMMLSANGKMIHKARRVVNV